MFITLTLNPAIDLTVTVKPPLSFNTVCAVMEEARTPGGKGVNVAKIIAANKKHVIAGGLLGKASLSFYKNVLQPVGISCRFLAVPHETRINTMFTDKAGHELKLNKPGFPELAYSQKTLLGYAASLVRPGAIVIMSGSLPVRFPADTYTRLIRFFRTKRCITVLDTSGPALIAGLKEKPDVIKPNRNELESALNRRLKTKKDVKNALQNLMKDHEAIVMSDGPRGAWFASRGTIFFAASPVVARVDTTGAGDTLLGQFCADYFPARLLTPEIAARAVAAGAAAVEQLGVPMLVTRRVDELAANVKKNHHGAVVGISPGIITA